MAERVFVRKLEKAGFVDIEIHERIPFSIDDAALYPLFTPDLVEMMQKLITGALRERVATSVLVTASKPG